MAKQRRTKPKSSSSKTPKKPAHPTPAGTKGVRPKRPAAIEVFPQPRSPHLDAIELYEQGVRALQAREYLRAAEILQSVIDRYSDEKELHERARLYLNIVERQTAPPDPTPKSREERVYAATLAINAGKYEEAFATLRTLGAEAPDNDHVQYMLAVVRAQRGELTEAADHLQRAVALNPENRVVASQDGDLEPLRRDPLFRTVIERSASHRDRRAPRRGSPR